MKVCLLSLFLIFAGSLFSTDADILVSVPPLRSIVHEISGGELDVAILVPPGMSPHSSEPTTKQMIAIRKAKIWFRIGENFENKLLPLLGKNKITIVDMRDGISLIQGQCSHGHAATDLHIWLSAKLLQIQAEKIAQTLFEHFPHKAKKWRDNYKVYSQKLQSLDAELTQLFDEKSGGTILVAHPAFAYFCRDYGLEQLAIEVEGKEPTAKQILALLEAANEHKVSHLFAELQYSLKGAEKIASSLGIEITVVDPYAENAFDNLKALASLFYDTL